MKNVEFFKKENLKDGMMVKVSHDCVGEQWYLKLGNKLICQKGYNNLLNYTNDLKHSHKDCEEFDIVEIGILSNDIYSIEDIFDPFNIKIIASRDVFKDEMIKSKIFELEKQLEKLKEELGE